MKRIFLLMNGARRPLFKILVFLFFVKWYLLGILDSQIPETRVITRLKYPHHPTAWHGSLKN